MRVSARSLPNNSIDSNSGGEIWLPVTAIRTAPNAILGFNPISSIRTVRSAASIESWLQTVNGASAASDFRNTSFDTSSEIFALDSLSISIVSPNRNLTICGTSESFAIRS
ncbi:unannotated protein [freshwater metagenome]|uniref:Unannotated protein n=1 Tax=freshwater metagenome TaxID=449393 RepID=A0A6J7MAN0_9ZZZZ